MRSLGEILSLRERAEAFEVHYDEWIAKEKSGNIIDVLLLFNDFFDEKYNCKIWENEIIQHPLLSEYISCFSISSVDEFDRMLNHLMNLLDILTLAREIDDFVTWKQAHKDLVDKLEKEHGKLRLMVRESMSLILKNSPLGLDMFEHYAPKESPIHRELNHHSYCFKKEWFSKRGNETKTGWLVRALCTLIPDEYINRAAFIAKLSTTLGKTPITRQNVSSILKGGKT